MDFVTIKSLQAPLIPGIKNHKKSNANISNLSVDRQVYRYYMYRLNSELSALKGHFCMGRCQWIWLRQRYIVLSSNNVESFNGHLIFSTAYNSVKRNMYLFQQLFRILELCTRSKCHQIHYVHYSIKVCTVFACVCCVYFVYFVDKIVNNKSTQFWIDFLLTKNARRYHKSMWLDSYNARTHCNIL